MKNLNTTASSIFTAVVCTLGFDFCLPTISFFILTVKTGFPITKTGLQKHKTDIQNNNTTIPTKNVVRQTNALNMKWEKIDVQINNLN